MRQTDNGVSHRACSRPARRFKVGWPVEERWLKRTKPAHTTMSKRGSHTWRFSWDIQTTSLSARDSARQSARGLDRPTAKVVDCVQMMLIFSLGRPDVLPVDDLGLLEGVREAYGLEARPTAKEVRERGES